MIYTIKLDLFIDEDNVLPDEGIELLLEDHINQAGIKVHNIKILKVSDELEG